MREFWQASDSPKIVIPEVRAKEGYYLVSLDRDRRRLVRHLESYQLERATEATSEEAISNDEALEYIGRHLSAPCRIMPGMHVEASGASVFLTGEYNDVKINSLLDYRLQGTIATFAISSTVAHREIDQYIDDEPPSRSFSAARTVPFGLYLAMQDATLLDRQLTPIESFPLIALPLNYDELRLSEIAPTNL
jgi:hypothetical protein